jgi:hypothetical protein
MGSRKNNVTRVNIAKRPYNIIWGGIHMLQGHWTQLLTYVVWKMSEFGHLHCAGQITQISFFWKIALIHASSACEVGSNNQLVWYYNHSRSIISKDGQPVKPNTFLKLVTTEFCIRRLHICQLVLPNGALHLFNSYYFYIPLTKTIRKKDKIWIIFPQNSALFITYYFCKSTFHKLKEGLQLHGI